MVGANVVGYCGKVATRWRSRLALTEVEMSVRRRKEHDPETGRAYVVWMVDTCFTHADGRRQRAVCEMQSACDTFIELTHHVSRSTFASP